MPQILDATDIELRNVKSWRRKLGIGDATTTLFERIETLVSESNITTTIDLASARLAAFATLDKAGYIVQTTTDPPTFVGRQIRGVANRINVTNGTGIAGDTIVQTPQDIHSGAIPMFLTIAPTTLTQEYVTYVNDQGHLASTTITAGALEGAVEADVLTTRGDLLTHDGTTYVRVPIGAANTVFRTDGLDGLWGKVVLTTDVSSILPTANGGTNHGNYTAGSVIFAGAGGMSLTEDNANIFWDDATNRFGIGTALPGAQLDISFATGPGMQFTRSVASATIADTLGQINFYNGATRAALVQGIADGATDSGAIVLWTKPGGGAFAQAVTIKGTGNTGVGLTLPLSRLHAAINDAVTTVTDVLRLNHSLSTGGTAANFGTGILLTGETSTTDAQHMARIQTIWMDSTHATRTSAIQFQTVNSAAALSTRMWITPIGVGIGTGTTAPGALLDLGLAGTTLGVMRLAGNTSGNVTIQPAAIAGTWTLTLPVNDGALGDMLVTDGSGITSWTAPPATISTPVSIANGGTFNTAFTSGRVIYYDGTRLTDDAGLTFVAATDDLVVGSTNGQIFLQPNAAGSLPLLALVDVGTYGAANYEAGLLSKSATAFFIRTAGVGTGTARAIVIGPGSDNAIYIPYGAGDPHVRIGDANTPTAKLHITAGAAAANSAPLKFDSGTHLTTPENGAVEYNGTNLFFTRTGAVREGVLTQSAVTTELLAADTSVTININGTTYKLLARA